MQMLCRMQMQNADADAKQMQNAEGRMQVQNALQIKLHCRSAALQHRNVAALHKSEDSTTAYGALVTCICGCAEYRRSLVRIGIDLYDLWIFQSPRCISYISHFGRMAILRGITILVKIAILVKMAITEESRVRKDYK